MPPAKKRKKPATRSKGMKPWHRRLISGAIVIVCLLIALALLLGVDSLRQDFATLQDSGPVYNWFSSAKAETENPIGLFGILAGNLILSLFGYWFALFGTLIAGLIALQYFLEPQT